MRGTRGLEVRHGLGDAVPCPADLLDVAQAAGAVRSSSPLTLSRTAPADQEIRGAKTKDEDPSNVGGEREDAGRLLTLPVLINHGRCRL